MERNQLLERMEKDIHDIGRRYRGTRPVPPPEFGKPSESMERAAESAIGPREDERAAPPAAAPSQKH